MRGLFICFSASSSEKVACLHTLESAKGNCDKLWKLWWELVHSAASCHVKRQLPGDPSVCCAAALLDGPAWPQADTAPGLDLRNALG